MARELKRLSPMHYEILRLHFLQLDGTEIATEVGCCTQTVSNVINSDEGRLVLDKMNHGMLDLTVDNLATLQAASGEILNEQIRLAKFAKDERVRGTVGRDLLAIVGLNETQKIKVEYVDPNDKYQDKTEDEIREEVLKEMGLAVAAHGGDKVKTVH